MFALLDQWRTAREGFRVADERREQAVRRSYVEPPRALIKTKRDEELFLTREAVGSPFTHPEAIKRMESFIALATGRLGIFGGQLSEMFDRAIEVKTAFVAHQAAEKAAKDEVGMVDIDRSWHEADAEECRLRRAVAETTPRTIPGLLAKLAAVADAYSLEYLEQHTGFADDHDVGLEDVAQSVLRDWGRLSTSGAANV